MEIAKFNEHITLQRQTVRKDAIGNHRNEWTDYFSCAANANTYEIQESGEEVKQENRTVVFTVRWCRETAAVTSTGYRVCFRGDVYNILSVDPMNYQKKEHQIAMPERGAPMSQKCSIEQLADVINQGLQEYAALTTSEVKAAVRRSAKTVKKEIAANAPAKSGRYAKSWVVKTTEENSQKLIQTVYSPSRYMLAHLLEHGHAKRGGGRVTGKPHIAPAEAIGAEQLEAEIERALRE